MLIGAEKKLAPNNVGRYHNTTDYQWIWKQNHSDETMFLRVSSKVTELKTYNIQTLRKRVWVWSVVNLPVHQRTN